MAKPSKPDYTALGVRERMLLFCVASGTDLQRTGIPGEVVTNMTVLGFVARDALGRLSLTPRGAGRCGAYCPGCSGRRRPALRPILPAWRNPFPPASLSRLGPSVRQSRHPVPLGFRKSSMMATD